MDKKLKAVIELDHYDGTTEFIGLKMVSGIVDNKDIPFACYGVVEDYASDRYHIWDLPPNANATDPALPEFTKPDMILEWEEIDWSELCVARCPDAKAGKSWLEQHQLASLALGGCCSDPAHGVDGTVYGGEDERRSAESGGDCEVHRDSDRGT